MPYIKLLTALAGLALLTACGGSATPKTDDTGGDTTTDCKTNAFHADCNADAPALALRESMCLANIQIDDSCRGEDGIATVFCKDDPFNTATACVADTYLPDRVEDCITDGNAGETKCNNLFTASASNTCLTNPFTDACTSDTEFDDYADDARVNRVSFCASDSTNSSLCTALTACQGNPFGTGCGAYFESAKNPYCGNNPTATSCVNTTVWLASFTGGEALTTTPNTTPTNEFLAITATTASSRTAVVPTTLFTTRSKNNGIAFFTENRVFYAGVLAGANLGAPITETITKAVRWTGQVRTVASNVSGTLTENPTAGFELDITFDGTKGTIKETFASSLQFAYKIDGVFDANGIITGTVDYGANTEEDGFNPTQFSDFYSPGTLRGIIGQDGAVGVFHSDNDNDEAGASATSFSGGFVARYTPPDPCIALDTCVDTADWVASFTANGGTALPTTPDIATQAPTHKNQFLQATPTGFASGANAGIMKVGLTPILAEIATVRFAHPATATGGVAYFGGGVYANGSRVGTDQFYYAGILAGTNLGAPITETITNARWTGQIRTVSNDSSAILSANPTAGFGVNITFDGTKGTIKENFSLGGISTAYEIDGMFDANGIITGTVDFGGVVSAGSSVINKTDFSYTPGTLSGIIGQNGAVGVFHSDNDNSEAGGAASKFSGGFVVTPPAN